MTTLHTSHVSDYVAAVLPYIASVVTVLLTYLLCRGERPYRDFLLVGMSSGKFGTKNHAEARLRYLRDPREVLRAGYQQAKCKCFQVLTTTGFKIIIPPKYIDDIKNNNNLSFVSSLGHDFFAHVPGFGAFNAGTQDNIIQDTIKVKLSGSLARVTDDLSQEMGIFADTHLPRLNEWREDNFREISMSCVAQLSSRVFLGEKLCRDPAWLEITIRYTIDAISAARALRMWPRYSHSIVHWFLPETRRTRADEAAAYAIIMPVLERRRQTRAENTAAGIETPKAVDALQWMEDSAKGRVFDVVKGQLGLSFASINTTSGMLQGIMYELCANPEYIDLLRQEIIDVLGNQSDGWKKTSLHALKMMDSVMKESQRFNVGSMSSFNRRVLKTTTLSDGTVLPKGALTIIPTMERMLDPQVWPEADKFIGRRFYDMRLQPGGENKGQLVTTSVNHYGFGHGTHACPGRFFASNEMKIILVHLLMKYDWKFPEEQGKPEKIFLGNEIIWNPKAKIMVKARNSEISFPDE